MFATLYIAIWQHESVEMVPYVLLSLPVLNSHDFVFDIYTFNRFFVSPCYLSPSNLFFGIFLCSLSLTRYSVRTNGGNGQA